jgi:hypothetical protein
MKMPRKFSMGKLLLNIAIYALIIGIVYETFQGYSEKFDENIALSYIAI